MPLVAIAGGTRLESWDLTADEWAALKRSYRDAGLIMSCGEPGIPKTSSLGTQFFAHKPKTDCQAHEGGPETPEHLRAKAVVAEAARAAGWTATVECPAPDRSWIADVMIEKDGRRVAVEIQWSKQSNADFRRRQSRYEQDGVKCFWLAGPTNIHNVEGVPSYSLSGTVSDLRMHVPVTVSGGVELEALANGIGRYCRGELKPRMQPVVCELHIRSSMVKCWSPQCGKWVTLWYLNGMALETRCAQKVSVSTTGRYMPWLSARIEGHFQNVVRSAIQNSDMAKPAYYATRKRVDGLFYLGQVCPHCNVIQGDGHVEQIWNWAEYSVPVPGGDQQLFALIDELHNAEHACLDTGRGTCLQGRRNGPFLYEKDQSEWELWPYEELVPLPAKKPFAPRAAKRPSR
jgi:hypothetical protein